MSNQQPFMHFGVIPDCLQQGKVEHNLADFTLLKVRAVFLVQTTRKRLAFTVKLSWIS